MRERFGVSERRALRVVAISRLAFSCKSKARDCSAIRLRMRKITHPRIHDGCERVLVMLRREGWRDNHKRGASHPQGRRLVFETLSAAA